MKHEPRHFRGTGAFTLPEMMISIGVLGLLGGVFFSVLQSGMVLFAKNVAVNVAHEETRQGINRLTRDIHASISIPELRNASNAVVNSQPAPSPAPTPIHASAVSFQNIYGGPHLLWQDPHPSLIKIRDFGVKPEPGMRLIVPFWGVEDDIIQVAAAGSHHHSNVFLKNGWQTALPRAEGGAYAIVYYTDRTMYAVRGGRFVKNPNGDYMPKDLSNNPNVTDLNAFTWFDAVAAPGNSRRYVYEAGELQLFKQRYNGTTNVWTYIATVARNVTTPFPFYVPLNSGGTANTKYVGVKLAAADPQSSNRKFRATGSLLDTEIDYRAAITIMQ
jgi:type II secretory pathway pseudopilin PulG